MRSEAIPFETPWLATYSGPKNALGLHDRQGYDTWLPSQFADGDRAMIIALPLVSDRPGYHAAAFRYYWSTVLPIVAEDLGEANLEKAHDTLARMFLPAHLVPKKLKRGLAVQRASTSLASMATVVFCDFIDRVIIWATTERGLIVPMANRRWKVEGRS